MRELNGIYTRGFNRRHRRVGHVLQGRYTAHLVDKDSYLKELCRYVVLNPVRAGMVGGPRRYAWSSYRATTGMVAAPPWLAVDQVLKHFGRQWLNAIQAYKNFIRDGQRNGVDSGTPKYGLFYGNEEFIRHTVQRLRLPEQLDEISREQRRVREKPLNWYLTQLPRNDAVIQAWSSGKYSQAEIARALGLHYSTVSRIIAKSRE